MSEDISQRLIRAVCDGNLHAVKTLVDTFGLSYAKEWLNGYFLLLIAVRNQQQEVSKLLLQYDCEVNERSDKTTWTPLHYAAKYDNTEIASMLLNKLANVHAINQDKETPLHVAVENRFLGMAKLLAEHASIDCIEAKTYIGVTPLQIAVYSGQFEIAEVLLNRGADANTTYTMPLYDGYTPLHIGAQWCDEPMVKLLLSKGAEINAIAGDGSTPLHAAIDQNYVREEQLNNIVKFLLENGANVDIPDNNGRTVLYIAVEKRLFTAIDHILNFRPDVNSEANRNSLHAAIIGRKCDHLEKIVDALLFYGYAVRAEDAKDAKLLHAAVERGCVKFIEALFMLGADVNTPHPTKRSVTLLHTAAANRQFQVTKLLLSRGANVNAEDDMQKLAICHAIENNDASITKLLVSGSTKFKVTTELFLTAVKNGSLTIATILLQLAPDIDINACDQQGRTALHYTALKEDWNVSPTVFHLEEYVANELPKGGRDQMAKMLLSRGAHVNVTTKNGTSALHSAVEGGYVNVVEVLLEYKADVNSLAEYCTTPLHLAVKIDKNLAIVKMLLDHGANVNVCQKNGTTALHIASENGHDEIVKLLVKRGADLDAKDMENSSPLLLATNNHHLNVVHTLLKFGANVEAKDNFGRTALHLVARTKGSPDIAMVLLSHGADINVTCNDSRTPLDHACIRSCAKIRRRNRYEIDEDEPYVIDDAGFNDCYNTAIINILKQHIVVMQAVDLFVSHRNLGAIDRHWMPHRYLEVFHNEIENFRTKRIGDSNVTFHDVLTKGINHITAYARNESIVQVLESEDFGCLFPPYSGLIVRRFKQGQNRERLLNSSFKSLITISGFALPYLSAINIFNYLSNRDLENLVKADPNPDD